MKNNQSRNRIVIVGNGFDLAHGLKTNYEDFLLDLFKSKIQLANNSSDKLYSCNLFQIEIKNPDRFSFELSKFKRIFSEIQSIESIGEFIKNSFVTGFQNVIKLNAFFVFEIKSKFFKSLLRFHNWKDIEGEYYRNLTEIYKKDANFEINLKKLNDDFELIKGFFIDYVCKIEIENNFSDRSKSELNSLVENKSVEIYSNPKLSIPKSKEFNSNINEILQFCLEIKEYSIGNANIDFGAHTEFYNVSLKSICFVNFNYTSNLKKYIEVKTNSKLFDNKKIKEPINYSLIHIHGEANNKDSIVFGYGDEMDGHFRGMEEMNIDGFLENFKSNFYAQNFAYFDLLKVMKEPFDVIVFGHSLGLSDRLLLNTIFEHENCNYIHLQYQNDSVNHFRKRLALSRHFDDKKKMRNRLFPILEDLKLTK